MYIFVDIRGDDAVAKELGLFEIKSDSRGGDVLTAFPSALEVFGQFVNCFLVEEHPV